MFSKIKEKIIEISSIFIACCALFLSINQADSTDYHNRLSVIPVLVYEVKLSENLSRLTYQITNKGLGPASITGMEYLQGETVIEENDLEVIFDFFSKKKSFMKTTILFSKIYGNNIIMPGKIFKLIDIPVDGKTENDKQKLMALLDDIKMGFCFRSMYGDSFFLKTYKEFPPKNSCNFKDAFWVFGHPIKLKSPWTKSISTKDLWG